jgi:hypothetical protein
MVWFFWMVYDTTVPSSDPLGYAERVHNIGLMQNRLIGIIIGLATLAVGLALTIYSAVMGRKR